MLVLSRKCGQSLMVGNSIEIKVIELSPGVVRLGIDAPAEISIYRDEIYREIALANQAALDDTAKPEQESVAAHPAKEAKQRKARKR